MITTHQLFYGLSDRTNEREGCSQGCVCPLVAAVLVDNSAALAPLAAAAVNEISTAIATAFHPNTTRSAAQGAVGALRRRGAAWRRAAAVMQQLTLVGACGSSGQRVLMTAGLDTVLVSALLEAPAHRVPDDEGAALADSTRRVLDLLQARMRWRGSAQVAILGKGSGLDAPGSALLSCMRLLHRGARHHPRHAFPHRI